MESGGGRAALVCKRTPCKRAKQAKQNKQAKQVKLNGQRGGRHPRIGKVSFEFYDCKLV